MEIKWLPKNPSRKGDKIENCALGREAKAQNLESVTGFRESLNLCSGCAQECSPSAQVKVADAHVQALKRNQRKKIF